MRALDDAERLLVSGSFERAKIEAAAARQGAGSTSERVAAECGRNDLRVSAWVQDHRAVISQLLAHCLRVSFDAPQRDVSQVGIHTSSSWLF